MYKKAILITFIALIAISLIFISIEPISFRKNPEIQPSNNSSVLNLANFEYNDTGLLELIKDFEKENLNIAIKINSYDKSIYYNIIKTSISSGIGPDLFELDNISVLNSYIAEYSVMALNDFINLDDFPSEYKLYTCVLNNNIYATPPLSTRMFVMIYNKDIFKQLKIAGSPRTGAELLGDFKLIKAHGIIPIAFGIKDDENIKNFTTQIGAYTEAQKLLSGFSSQDFDSLTRKIRSFKEFFPDDFYNLDSNDAKQLFISGKCAVIFGMDNEEKQFSRLCKFDIGSTFIYNTYNYKSFYNYSGSYAININTPNKISAIEFVKYLSDKSVIGKYNKINLDSSYSMLPDILLPQYSYKYMLNWIYKFKSKDLLLLDDYYDKLRYELIK